MSELLYLKALTSINDIDAAAWNACADPGGAVATNPFLLHAFFKALEDSRSAVPERGWQPIHAVLQDTAGAVQGAVPLYLKSHSRGEYVFDSNWAEAFHRAGGQYYPKLQGSVPFTPATGRRLLARAGPDQTAIEAQLAAGSCQLAEKLNVSSLHFTFVPEQQWQHMAELGFLQRIDQQFHWQNNGYGSFDEFLAELASKKRKNLKRERRDALQNGITVEWLTGSDLREHHWDAFFRFYMDTGNRKWGTPYLTREFFSLVSASMADHILLILCKRDGRYIAGALNFIGSDTLFGRNWGCIEDHRFLHFEVCYYQAIDFAIARGLQHVEAGAQGQHKVARGYLPQATYSAHWIADKRFRTAVARYLNEERKAVQEDIAWVAAHTPFRNADQQDEED